MKLFFAFIYWWNFWFYFWIRSLCGRQLTRSVSTLYFYLLIRSVMWQQKTLERLKESRRILKEFIYHLVSLVGIFQSFIWIHKWAFHSIFVTWFLVVLGCFGLFWVVLGDQVTKILHNSLFTFLLSKARQANRKFKVKKITKPKWRKNQKRSYQNL